MNQVFNEMYHNNFLLKKHNKAISAKDGNYTYCEVEELSNLLANYIIDSGSTCKFIYICLDRSKNYMIAILAAWKLNIPYIPINIEKKISDIKFNRDAFVITNSFFYSDLLINPGENIINIENLIVNKYISKAGQFEILPSYLMYTSGSTGTPKGILINSSNILHLYEGLIKDIYLKLDMQHTILGLVSPFYFDASLNFLLLFFFNGNELVIVDEITRKDGISLYELYCSKKVTFSDGTPYHASILQKQILAHLSKNTLQGLFIGGEKLNKTHIKDILLNTDMKIINLYGPTECTVNCLYFIIDKENINLYDEIPLGNLLGNSEVFIKPVDESSSGEIVIKGKGIANGYVESSEQTISNPFRDDAYFTGDLGYIKNGLFYFRGRKDNQIKINGYRIELVEIENLVIQLLDVEELTITYKNNMLLLFIRCKPNNELVKNEIFDVLNTNLPQYMIPHDVVLKKDFPYTDTGKINKEKLHNDFILESEVTDNHVDVKSILKSYWIETTNFNSEMTIDTDFFMIGGNSLKAIYLSELISRKFKIEYDIIDVLNNSRFEEQLIDIINKTQAS